jgi:AbrB family looped-hinge helix DNA binding protein
MTHRAGTKGQVVIPKAIRDRLGIRPGTRVIFGVDGEAVKVIPFRLDTPLGGRYPDGGTMAERLLEDRRAEPR